ncbi:MAG TPA: ornithine cyclodeaminase family protein [Candidatus Binataceae bacterium]|nr:ornithine cyclodeaminase family protein [Candidatus Binataceae bacterium]
MQQLDSREVASRLDRSALIDALDAAFRTSYTAPERQQYSLPSATDQGARTLLVMPAWREDGTAGVKVVTVFADNARRRLPAVHASYLLLDGTTGETRAILDGSELTLWRTGAASALAARHLSRPDASRLLMVGAGRLAPHLIESHRLVRPIREVRVWGRRHEAAQALAAALDRDGLDVTATEDLRESVQWADIVSCATLSGSPLVLGTWLRPGQHLDLVGSFTPAMREVDDAALLRSEIYVDSRRGALAESGELLGAIARGAIRADAIRAELSELASGRFRRSSEQAITTFKSVGVAIEDLVAAQMVVERAPR